MDKSPYIQRSSEITKIGRLEIHMDQLEHKGVVRPYSYAICSNKINKSLEPLEVIESDLYTFDEVDKMVDDGRISLGNAILCWIRYKKRIEY